MTTNIHPTAIVSSSAELGRDVEIGPYCIVEDGVRIGDRCSLATGSVIKRGTIMGAENCVAERAILGGKPQHARCGAEYGRVRIGDRNEIREHVTIHAAFKPGDETRIGDGNLIMVNAHIAHDVVLGNQIVLVNNVMLAGHVVVEDRAYLGGAVGVHQFCRIGRLAMVGGQAHVSQDVPPYVTIDGSTTRVVGLNRVGLRRAGFTEQDMIQLKTAYRIIYRAGLRWSEVIEQLTTQFPTGPAAEFAPFLQIGKRGFIHERRTPRSATLRLPDPALQDPADNELRRVG